MVFSIKRGSVVVAGCYTLLSIDVSMLTDTYGTRVYAVAEIRRLLVLFFLVLPSVKEG